MQGHSTVAPSDNETRQCSSELRNYTAQKITTERRLWKWLLRNKFQNWIHLFTFYHLPENDAEKASLEDSLPLKWQKSKLILKILLLSTKPKVVIFNNLSNYLIWQSICCSRKPKYEARFFVVEISCRIRQIYYRSLLT